MGYLNMALVRNERSCRVMELASNIGVVLRQDNTVNPFKSLEIGKMNA